jgi:hypothetical protein
MMRWPIRSPTRTAAGLRQERDALDQAGNHGCRRHLYAPRLLAVVRNSRRVPKKACRRLAGRFPVPLPRFDLRLRRPCLQEQAGPDQPRSAAARVSVRYPHPDRRRQEGGISMAAGNFEKYKSDGSCKAICWSGSMPVSRRRRCGRPPVRVLRAEELQLLVFLRLAGDAGSGHPDRHRHLPGHALQAGCLAERQWRSGGLRQRRVHHARRAGGWLIRYMHSTGASAFFIVVYLHMFRGMLYGSYRKPRELIWLSARIFLCLMAEAFMGYLLPWGQMSFWGAQVIVNLFSAIPVIGEPTCRSGFAATSCRRCDAEPLLLLPRHRRSRWCCSAWSLRTSWRCTKSARTIRTASRSRNKDENGIPLDGIPSTRTTRSRTSSASWSS